MALQLNKAIFNPTLYARVRTVWFQDLPATAQTAPMSHYQRWFGLGPASDRASFDSTCRSHFLEALDAISPSSLRLSPLPSPGGPVTRSTERSLDSALAQPFLETLSPAPTMPRNVFREPAEQALVYNHYDRIARSIVHALFPDPQVEADVKDRSAVAASAGAAVRESFRPDTHPELATSPAYRTWFYLPLMHSEHLGDHEHYMNLMRSCRDDVVAAGCGEEVLKAVDMSLEFEEKHLVIIKRFGRYPYRNEVLGRETTAEEKEYLDNGGDTFGAGKKE
ncbi:unnamed protein product [Parascedosporium putredinis]|uniref:Uncharacterized protein n=1 Tax=Parascedosporium putredinis TaxID=1442378 RepID=A0A9P1GX18_9PEZI|nr:unnamed protein product [Parascedosporium putredinis]CAI7988627.1 unnamed protein product [Parascedosporium putredinis]